MSPGTVVGKEYMKRAYREYSETSSQQEMKRPTLCGVIATVASLGGGGRHVAPRVVV